MKFVCVLVLIGVCWDNFASARFSSSPSSFSPLSSLSTPFPSSRWLSGSKKKKLSSSSSRYGQEEMDEIRDEVIRSGRVASLRMSTLLDLCGGAADGEEGNESKVKGMCVGIDLGTTYSCVAVWKNGRVEICPNEQGNRITPSYVAWSDGQRLIGDAAKNQASSNPQNTVFDVKRLIGRKFTDSSVQKDQKLMPFKLTNKCVDFSKFSIFSSTPPYISVFFIILTCYYILTYTFESIIIVT